MACQTIAPVGDVSLAVGLGGQGLGNTDCGGSGAGMQAVADSPLCGQNEVIRMGDRPGGCGGDLLEVLVVDQAKRTEQRGYDAVLCRMSDLRQHSPSPRATRHTGLRVNAGSCYDWMRDLAARDEAKLDLSF
ncbi:hypothetical protein BIV57_02020 [Mangrovactinospora gilvigrisea]|uniref:Uncharacterized protein n=1 Tax=Mangrovactinospora gilvigrisea TaxID=1428644 RepID=A0A1J7CHL4_9ACTN|nr:hypothetical protein BIV57_02020 [Mangrovactinospora gilvigrisea]